MTPPATARVTTSSRSRRRRTRTRPDQNADADASTEQSNSHEVEGSGGRRPQQQRRGHAGERGRDLGHGRQRELDRPVEHPGPDRGWRQRLRCGLGRRRRAGAGGVERERDRAERGRGRLDRAVERVRGRWRGVRSSASVASTATSRRGTPATTAGAASSTAPRRATTSPRRRAAATPPAPGPATTSSRTSRRRTRTRPSRTPQANASTEQSNVYVGNGVTINCGQCFNGDVTQSNTGPHVVGQQHEHHHAVQRPVADGRRQRCPVSASTAVPAAAVVEVRYVTVAAPTAQPKARRPRRRRRLRRAKKSKKSKNQEEQEEEQEEQARLEEVRAAPAGGGGGGGGGGRRACSCGEVSRTQTASLTGGSARKAGPSHAGGRHSAVGGHGGRRYSPAPMFTKVLVANRGEIAVRVIRCLKEMGVASVAVYSEVDREAPHVREADESYLLGPGPAAESYLKIEKILEVRRAVGRRGDPPRLRLPGRERALREGLREGRRRVHRPARRRRSRRWARRRRRAS